MSGCVVVSGLGVVGPFGSGREALAAGLASGRAPRAEVDRSAGRHAANGARTAALVGGLDLSRWVRPAAARRMSGPSKLAVAAARMAVEDARLEGACWDDTAVFLSTAFGPSDCTARLFAAIEQEGPETASPFLFTESVANAPAAQIAIERRARGPNVTVTQREAGPLIAVARAAREVARGSVRRALAGSVEEITPMLHALLDRFGALARATADQPEAARPFDRRRNGLVAGEGATVLVLEREDDVRARGADVLARVLGGASAFDPTASRVGWGKGAATLSSALRRLLGPHVAGRPIDLIVSGASGSVAGDRLEAGVLRGAFDVLPALTAPKGATGEYGGGLLAAAVLAASGACVGPTAGFCDPDPDLGIVPHAGGFAASRVLASSLAAGGAAAWLLLERS